MLTVEQAKKKIEELQFFVDVAESYIPETIEQHVIKQYAFTSSWKAVVENLSALGFEYNNRPLCKWMFQISSRVRRQTIFTAS